MQKALCWIKIPSNCFENVTVFLPNAEIVMMITTLMLKSITLSLVVELSLIALSLSSTDRSSQSNISTQLHTGVSNLHNFNLKFMQL